ALNSEGTITSIKRLMGTKEKVTVYGKEYTPQQISAFILQKIKKDAEAYLGEAISQAVITVPAYFNDDQRQATKDAGSIAGLEVTRLVNEPTAAAFAYGLEKADANMKIMVVDLGGGTLDVTIMDFGGGVFEVASTSGDTNLGGTDMDKALFDFVCDQFQKDTGIDLRKDKSNHYRLYEAVEKAKIELSTTLETEINLPFITVDASNTPQHLNIKITRSRLEQLVKSIVDKIKGPMEQSLKDADLTPQKIDKIILVGGPTRMPVVQKTIEDFMGKKLERGVDPMECVSMGAAIQGGIITGDVKNVVLVDVTPLSLGIETLGGISTKMIDRNSSVPISKSQIFSTAADNQSSVEVHVLQGERSMATDNVSLGRFILDGIPPAPRGLPQIEVTFSIDANGILTVKAKDKATSKEQHITITNANKLTDDDIEKMKKEAEQFADQDKKRAESIETRNKADSLVYSARKSMKELEEKADATDLKAANDKIDELEKALKEDKDIEEIKKLMEEVSNLIGKVGEKIYQQEAAKSASEDANTEGSNTTGEAPNEEPKDTAEGQAKEI
ncbi:MAG: molecular chaperone DnaK, partial [Caldisericia bacterium]|nr:molecular chaperone DnaK [Caldisericia bacterium]